MSKKSKAKKSARGVVRHKKMPAAHGSAVVAHGAKSLPERRKEAAERHAASTKSLLAHKPKPRREPLIATELPHRAVATNKKKSKRKQAVTLRFTENTLKDIAALECVRRCFR